MLFSGEVDSAAVDAAFTALPALLKAHCDDACRITAQAIVTEAKARLQRQIGPQSTGQTVAGIEAKPAYDGNGWVVLADNERMPNLPLWLERGTSPGKRRNYARTAPRPFFYASIALEAVAHERRILDAMQASASDVGLGG